MKQQDLFATTATCLLITATASLGNLILIDSFSEGEFYIDPENYAIAQDYVTSPLVNMRTVAATGLGTWSVTLASGSGFLAYEATDYIPGGRGFSVDLHYTQGDRPLGNILDYDAIELDFADVAGSGLVRISVNTSDMDNVVEVPVTSAGILSYPVSYLAVSNLNVISALDIRLSPDGGDFSFQLNQIGVVPEPSSGLLLGIAALFFGMRRRMRPTRNG